VAAFNSYSIVRDKGAQQIALPMSVIINLYIVSSE